MGGGGGPGQSCHCKEVPLATNLYVGSTSAVATNRHHQLEIYSSEKRCWTLLLPGPPLNQGGGILGFTGSLLKSGHYKCLHWMVVCWEDAYCRVVMVDYALHLAAVPCPIRPPASEALPPRVHVDEINNKFSQIIDCVWK